MIFHASQVTTPVAPTALQIQQAQQERSEYRYPNGSPASYAGSASSSAMEANRVVGRARDWNISVPTTRSDERADQNEVMLRNWRLALVHSPLRLARDGHCVKIQADPEFSTVQRKWRRSSSPKMEESLRPFRGQHLSRSPANLRCLIQTFS